MTTSVIDRRAANKARVRTSILDAARALIVERSGPRFSVDELAARADVARRTVFNHFASLDEIVLTLAGEVLGVLIDEFTDAVTATPVGDGSRASLFEELANSLRSADVMTAIVTLTRMLGTPEERGARSEALAQEAFARVGGTVVHEIERRNPAVDPLDVELLLGSLMNGMVVIAQHWVANVGTLRQSDPDPAARAQWDALLERLLGVVRNGYLSTS